MFEKLDVKFVAGYPFDYIKLGNLSTRRTDEFCLPLVNAKKGSKGIMYWARRDDFESASNVVAVIADGAISTGDVHAHLYDVGVLYNAYLIRPLQNFAPKALVFIAQCIQKAIKFKYGYENKCIWSKVKNDSIMLPLLDDAPDFEYMAAYVRHLEALCLARIKQAAACEPLMQDADILSHRPMFCRFRIGDIFTKLSSRYNGEGDKFRAVSKIKSAEHSIPVVYAKFGDNGVMYWAREGDFETHENAIAVIYNGAIAAGLVYAQKHPTGILAESYLISLKNGQKCDNLNLYLASALQKSLYPLYSREYLATWPKVKNDFVSLPVDENGAPDYKYMAQHVEALKRANFLKMAAYADARLLPQAIPHQGP